MGKLGKELDAWTEANRPACPIGRLQAGMKPDDSADLDNLLDRVSATGRTKIASKDAAALVNKVYGTELRAGTILDHTAERCSCGQA